MTEGLGTINVLQDMANAIKVLVMNYRLIVKNTNIENPTLNDLSQYYDKLINRIDQIKDQSK